jgi:hypothetical protein
MRSLRRRAVITTRVGFARGVTDADSWEPADVDAARPSPGPWAPSELDRP